jgi:hypothetical protein
MKNLIVIILSIMLLTVSCSKKQKKIVHLTYSSMDTIKALPIVVNEKGRVDQITVFITKLAEDNLRQSKRFEFMDINNWALMRDSPNTILKINKIHHEMKRVVAFFQNNKMERAFDLAEKLLILLSKNFQYFEDLDEVYFLKSYQAASALLGDVIDNERFFYSLAVMNPHFDFDRNKFGPGLSRQFKMAVKETKRYKKGIITVNSSPISAKVFIDGIYAGITPFQSEKIKTGEHYIKVETDGYYPYGEIVNVLPQENPVDATLKNFTINRELNILRQKLTEHIEKKKVKFPKIVLKFLRVIPFNQMIFIKTQAINDDIFLKVYIYDIPTTSLYKTSEFKINLNQDNIEDNFNNQFDKV